MQPTPIVVGDVHENLSVELSRERRDGHDSASRQFVQLRINGVETVRLAPDAQPPFGLPDLSTDDAGRLAVLVDDARRRAWVHGSGLI